MTAYSLWIGFDPRESTAFAVARKSVRETSPRTLPITGLVLNDLRKRGLYYRETEFHSGVERPVMWDVISDAPMSTEFAISRFLVPHLAETGWAMFMDCDMLVRGNVMSLMRSLDPKYAVYCVKHQHTPKTGVKMDGQQQTSYARKNWSSVMVFNCDHPSNKALTVEMVNSLPGRELHRFCWLKDEDIGTLDPEWNYLVGEQPKQEDPQIVHFTTGGPWFPGYEYVPFADEWRACLERWAA